jgi:prepilin-type N-terminal cleavage/methylation domain-containing protein
MMFRRLDAEDGVTMIEMLVGVVIMAIAMSIASLSTVHALKVQRRQVAEVDTVNRTRIVMERMTREIRAANPLLAASADGSQISIQVTRPVAGWNRKITTYQLVGTSIQSSGTLINTTTNATQAVPVQTILTGVTLNPGETLFSYRAVDGSVPVGGTTDLATYHTVTITLRMALSEGGTVLVSDMVTLRNVAV